LSIVKDARIVRIQAVEKSWNFNFELEAAKQYRLTLIARSDEVDSQPFVVDVCWDGQWLDDETQFSPHLKVKEVVTASLALMRPP
jgi:hypothetical protein